MRFYNLQPTNKNIFETFSKNAIGRNEDVIRFAKILNLIEGGCSVAIESGWGNGKTFFVKQVKMVLDTYNQFINRINEEESKVVKSICNNYFDSDEVIKSQVTVYYDAWENDNDNDPLMSMICSIVDETDKKIPLKKETKAVEIAASIIDILIDRDTTKMIQGITGEDLLSNARENRRIKEIIKEFLEKLLEERGDRLVVFIDELDRCSPAFAVRLLERVKHYLSCDRITFVFSVNIGELQHTIKNCYGEGFDACKYLDRFFDLPITLPPVDLNKYYEFIDYPDDLYTYDCVAKAVIEEFNFGLREIEKYVSLIKKSAQSAVHNNIISRQIYARSGKEFAITYVLPIMLGLEISDVNTFNQFVKGENINPILDISKYFENTPLFNVLLSKGESYDDSNVRIEEKLHEVYDAIFNYNYLSGERCIHVGNCEFDKNLKNVLLKTVSLLSDYADLSL